jgi:hypothetical protein
VEEHPAPRQGSEAFARHLKQFDEEEVVVKERLKQVMASATRLEIAERLKISAVMASFEALGPPIVRRSSSTTAARPTRRPP